MIRTKTSAPFKQPAMVFIVIAGVFFFSLVFVSFQKDFIGKTSSTASSLKPSVKEKKGLWKLSKTLGEETAHAIYPNIYVPTRIYKDLQSSTPDPKNLSYIAHEGNHIKRQEEIGWHRWMVFYALSAQFRLSEELIAIEAEMNVLKEHDVAFEIEAKSRALSSFLYLRCVSYDQAIKLLTDMWEAV